MATYDDFLGALKSSLSQYAKQAWADYRDQAQADGQAFIDQTKQDLQIWSQQLAAGQITQVEFRFNVNSKKSLAQLVSLKQAGLAKVSADKFTNGLVDVIVNTAVSTFL
jgi:hypothetical protein